MPLGKCLYSPDLEWSPGANLGLPIPGLESCDLIPSNQRESLNSAGMLSRSCVLLSGRCCVCTWGLELLQSFFAGRKPAWEWCSTERTEKWSQSSEETTHKVCLPAGSFHLGSKWIPTDVYSLFFFFNLFYLFICGWVGASLLRADFRRAGLLLLRSAGSRCTSSIVVAPGLSCSTAYGIFLDEGSNLCPLHWQADSQPLPHQGSPVYSLLKWVFCYLPLGLPTDCGGLKLCPQILWYSSLHRAAFNSPLLECVTGFQKIE